MRTKQCMALVVCTTALFAAGCGGDDGNQGAQAPSAATTQAVSGGSGVVAQARAAVEKAKAPVDQFFGPSSSAKPAGGKKIVVVTCTSQGIGCVRAGEGVKEAGKELGWETTIVDGKGDPKTWNSAIQNAITTKADGIVLSAVPTFLVGDGLQKASAAKIPVVSVWNPLEPRSKDVAAYVGFDHVKQGATAADWVIADSEGKAKVIEITLDDFPELKERRQGFEKQLAACDGCEVVAKVPTTVQTFATGLPGAVASALQQHPNADYLIAPADTIADFATSGVRQAGKTDAVKIANYDAAPSNLDSLRKGDVLAMTIAEPAEWMGWQAAAAFVDLFAGQKPKEYEVRYRTFTRDNVPEGKVWQGDMDFRAVYRKLWGLG